MKMAEIDASFNFMFTSHKDFQAYKAQDLYIFQIFAQYLAVSQSTSCGEPNGMQKALASLLERKKLMISN